MLRRTVPGSTDTTTVSTDGRTPDQWTDAELAAFGDAHDPRTCTTSQCRELPAGTDWLSASMAITPAGTLVLVHDDYSLEVSHRARARDWRNLVDTYTAHPHQFLICHQWLTAHPLVAAPAIDTDHPTYQVLADAAATGSSLTKTEALALAEDLEAARPTRADRGLAALHLTVHATPTRPQPVDDELLGPRPTFCLEHGPHLWWSDTVRRLPAHELVHLPAADHTSLGRILAGHSTHDHHLDVTADTYEQAIIALAAAVHTHYGHDRSRIHHP